MKNVAILLAGGSGKRMGASVAKQFLKINNKTIIEYSIEAFEENSKIDEICIVINADYIDDIKKITAQNKYKKVVHILNGGKERSDSSLAAIRQYNDTDVNFIFHDAVRPFVSQKIINDVISGLEEGKNIAVAIPATDTIFEVNDSKELISVPNRNRLQRAQTPQAFSLQTIKKAYDIALNDPYFKATDDCGVVLKYLPEEKINIVQGDEQNIKITYEGDLKLAEIITYNTK